MIASTSVKKEEGGGWVVDTSYTQNRPFDTENMARKATETEQNETTYANPQEKKFTLDILRAKEEDRLPEINPLTKELYLSDEDFQTVFKMSPDEFTKLQKWKKDKLKKENDLF